MAAKKLSQKRLETLYNKIREGVSAAKLAKTFGVTIQTIYYHMRKVA